MPLNYVNYFLKTFVKLESREKIVRPTKCLVKTFGTFVKILTKPINPQHLKLNAELEHWQQKSKFLTSQFPYTAEAVLNCCDKDIYPIIHQLLKILTTIPVINASVERSFHCDEFLK